MSKLQTIALAILGGVDVAVNIVTPIILSLLVIKTFPLSTFNTNLIVFLGIVSALFKGIKIGWLK